MRKRNIMFIADTIFWYLIYFLPVILYGIYMIHAPESGSSLVPITDFMNVCIRSVVNDSNPILLVLKQLFAYDGIIPFFSSSKSFILDILTWFATMNIIHLAIDFVLFIPRLCHKWLDMYTKGVEK